MLLQASLEVYLMLVIISSCFFAGNRRLRELRGMGRECIGVDMPLSIISFGKKENQILSSPLLRLFRKIHARSIFGNTKLCLAFKSGNIIHRNHKIELTFCVFLQAN